MYVRDSGILHRLLGIATRTALDRHPKIGASWEGFVIENLIHTLEFEDRQCFFWGTHRGFEIDPIVDQGDSLRGFEVKRASAPRLTPSMRAALQDLELSRLDVIHAGPKSYPLATGVQAISYPGYSKTPRRRLPSGHSPKDVRKEECLVSRLGS